MVYSPELTAVIAANPGITPTMSGGYSGDPDDMPVYTGTKDEPVFKTDQFPFGGTQAVKRPKPTTKMSSQMEKDFYSLDPTERATLQKRLYAGGFYGDIDPEKVILGIPDETSFRAYRTAVGRAASYYAAGQRKTLDDVLDEAAGIWEQVNGPGGAGAGGRGGGSGSGKQPLTVALTSPEDLRAVAQKTATSTLGRALTDQEIGRFVSAFHSSQSSAQTAEYDEAAVVTAPTSPGVAAEQFARGTDPTAAGGQGFLKTYQAFSRILGGGR